MSLYSWFTVYRYCSLPTRTKSSVSCSGGASFVIITVTFGVRTPENAVEILVIMVLKEVPILYTATTAVLATIPKITLSVAQNVSAK